MRNSALIIFEAGAKRGRRVSFIRLLMICVMIMVRLIGVKRTAVPMNSMRARFLHVENW